MAEVSRQKYSRLDSELGRLLSEKGFDRVKTSVIGLDVTAQLNNLPKYFNVAQGLGLSEEATGELFSLYGHINRMSLMILNMRIKVIGVRLIGGTNVAPPVRATEQTRDMCIYEFTNFFSGLLNNEDLKDKKSIKKAVLYPLAIATFNTWKRFDREFAVKLIREVEAAEGDAELKWTIRRIDSTPVPPRG